MKIQRLALFNALCAVISSILCNASSGYLIKTAREFNNMLDEHSLLVAYVYDLPESAKLKTSLNDERLTDAEQLKQRLTGMVDKRDQFYERYKALVALAQSKRYQTAHVGFCAVNVAVNDLGILKSMLKLRDGSDALILFKDGKPYGDHLPGEKITEVAARNLIEGSFRDYINDELEEQKQQKKEFQLARNKKAFVESSEKSSGKSCKSCKRRRCSSCYYAPWWVYGNYYYGPYPYYPAPYGYGCGWGGCCGAPGFGFGVTLCG